MHARNDNKIILTMNPKELRDLADKMEEIYPKKNLGEDLFVARLSHVEPEIHLYRPGILS